ncbi:MAG: hypothetical protein NT084_04345 [Bacteroidetes bacterium]|jgi:hypothetical protein|nr:hypothetical protein [Bacteroidota bacterium]
MSKKYKHGKTSLPLLVTLTGCVLMFACMSPVNANEITKQLSVKGYELARRNIKELHVVVTNAHEAKHILESLHLSSTSHHFSVHNDSSFIIRENLLSYTEIFSNFVKRSQYENLRSWLMRE